jgi:hypothetical protein
MRQSGENSENRKGPVLEAQNEPALLERCLARHSTITLIMDRYTHTLHEQELSAIAVLPDLSCRTSSAGVAG